MAPTLLNRHPRSTDSTTTGTTGPGAGRTRPGRPGRRTAVGAGLVVVLLVLLAAWWATTQRWTTVWRDDFDGAAGSLPSQQDWVVDTGTQYPGGAPQWGTGEIQTYTDDPANLATDGKGRLAITPTQDPSGAWRSGRVETRRTDFAAPDGGQLRVEARVRVPDGGQGYWAAFWMLGEGFRGAPTNWPMAGEVDILENLGSEPSTVHMTLHCGTAPGGPCRENDGLSGARSVPDGTPLSAGFHDYAVVQDRSTSPEELRWYLDGELVHTVKESDVPPDVWAQATHHGFFVLLNVAVGGGWPGAPDGTTRPGRPMLVDSVTVSTR